MWIYLSISTVTQLLLCCFGSEVFEFIVFLFLGCLPVNFSFKECLQEMLITYTLTSPKILMVEYRKNDRYSLITTTRVNIGDILGAKPISNTSFYVLTVWPLWASIKYMNLVYVNVQMFMVRSPLSAIWLHSNVRCTWLVIQKGKNQ